MGLFDENRNDLENMRARIGLSMGRGWSELGSNYGIDQVNKSLADTAKEAITGFSEGWKAADDWFRR